MTLQDQIKALLEEAEPLRALPPEEHELAGLQKLVARINALRAEEARLMSQLDAAIEQRDEAEFAVISESVAPKRGPGRPRKQQQ